MQVLAVAFLMEIDDKMMDLVCNMGWKVPPPTRRSHSTPLALLVTSARRTTCLALR